MKDFVSRIKLFLVSVLLLVAGILVADLPWTAFIFVSVAAALALWQAPAAPTRSVAQLFRDLEALPVRAVAPVRGVAPAPKPTL